MNLRFLGLGAAALALGGATLLYHALGTQLDDLPARAFVRGYLGDVAATMLVYALFSLIWHARPWVRAVATLAVATTIEFGQMTWHARSLAGELIVGSTFDGMDFAAYVAGVAVALLWEHSVRAHQPRF
jgi:hypothetical protein